ncbi:cerebellar degeneration-related protein 2-like isoform X2 [Solenopsis invicta]|uniref:cerebellar degeneration-related protein 2-like isoform X2 n=1 Tax=Solenopsis invicta TaxID=13686 RepID=UPI00193E03F7|nr:cerebellar degeneration-related protein 2-like isoform X2 [Solenopsis invicta]
MSLLSSSIGGGGVRYHADEDADQNMLQDLQLAAELGKTLLERNKELENIIKLHQATVEEQTQEIEYMKKQTAALREVNNTRLKVYEQLEVSVQDLERANHHLVIENTSDKKLIKSQSVTIENLEIRCEELQKKIDDLTQQLRQHAASPSRNNAQHQQHQQQQLQQQHNIDWETSDTQGGSEKQRAAPCLPKPAQETAEITAASDEEMTELLRQLQDARNQRAREQKKVSELSQQLTTLLQENSALEEQLTEWRNKAQDVKSLQDEINTLEEVRRGQLCGRCLRGMDTRTHDELTIMLDQEEYDDISMAESLISENQRDSELTVQDTSSKNEGTDELDSTNPYRVLVEKYQALLEVQRHCQPRRKDPPAACMSLQEELEMSGEFNNFYPPVSEVEVAAPEATKTASRTKPENAGKKPFSATPTDFSEAETSSSGFSDETSNKATQTDDRQGSFLCSIADGEDCKFSIYDDNSPFESRFRKTPEYRQLFSEIFSVLKRAAEAKDEGEKLPLLDDSTPSQTKYDTSFQEDLQSEATDDNQSVMSSMVSSVVSEPVFRVQSASPKDKQSDNKSNSTAANQQPAKDASCRMDYVSLNLRVRKKPLAKKNFAKKGSDRSTPDVIPTTNPKFVPPKSSGRRRFKPFNPDEHTGIWNGQHNAYPNRSRDNKKPFTRGSNEQQQQQPQQQPQQQQNNFEYKDFKPSTASEEVARLKRLELSYAEVLRTPNNKSRASNNNNHHHHHHQQQHHHHHYRRN